MNNNKEIYLRCEDGAEMMVFTKYQHHDGDTDYDFTIQDSYCGGDYMGIKGRFKRAWKAFWAEPIYYTGVYCQDQERAKKFLKDCLNLIEE